MSSSETSLSEQISVHIRTAILAAIDAGQLPKEISKEVPESISLERPKNRDHGDYATSIALQLAKPSGKNPREVAGILQSNLAVIPEISKVDIAGPGFLNITLNRASQAELVGTILSAQKNYGRSTGLAGVRINLEFISANPTGPLHLGHTRWAAVGDALGRVLSAAGADVVREFYVNDRGNQMDLFGASLAAAAKGLPIPENGYHGEYIKDLAKEVVEQNPGINELSGDDSLVAFREAGYKLQLAQQQGVLKEFGTIFDVWYSERKLHDSGAVANVAEKLKKNGYVYEDGGATWLRTTDFGDDKDRVLVKADGEQTYFTSDTAYYLDKSIYVTGMFNNYALSDEFKMDYNQEKGIYEKAIMIKQGFTNFQYQVAVLYRVILVLAQCNPV